MDELNILKKSLLTGHCRFTNDIPDFQVPVFIAFGRNRGGDGSPGTCIVEPN